MTTGMAKTKSESGRYKLTIPGRLPNLNEYIRMERANRQAAASLKRKTENKIGLLIKQQLPGVRITKPVVLIYTWCEANRKRDLDNIAFAHKFVQDALVDTGVLGGDGWKHIMGFRDMFIVDKDRPRVEVIIEVTGERP